MHDSIENFMTQTVHTIAATRTLADAHEMMREFKIRHLPVLKGGQVVGMVTDRDLHMVETLKQVDPKKVSVDEAMSQDVFSVSPQTPLADVAQSMALRRLGSVVVTQGHKVVGIFTAVDALRTLDFLLSSPVIKRVLGQAMVPAAETEVA
jgi:acetoin utilization protein AcuB